MSQGFVPGPCQVFVGTGTSKAWEFLGLSEDGVQLQLLSSFEDIYNDAGGPMVPIDVQWMGEQAYMSMTMNKYNESVLQKCAARRVGTGIVPGACEVNGLGSLMIAEGFAYPILLLFPYRAKTFQNNVIVPCYNFSAGWLQDDFSIPLSVRLKRPRVIFRAIPLWDTLTLQYVLYTNVLPDPLPSVN